MTDISSKKRGSQEYSAAKVLVRGISGLRSKQATTVNFLVLFLFLIGGILSYAGVARGVVEVTANGVVCHTETDTAGTIITNQAVADLPLNNRSFSCLATIAPGTVNITATHNFPLTSNPILLDGTNTYVGTVTNNTVEWDGIPIEAIADFTITGLRGNFAQSTPYYAASEQITVTQKSGTAEFQNPQFAMAIYCPSCSQCSSVIPSNQINGNFKIFNQNMSILQPNTSFNFSGTFDPAKLTAGKISFAVDLGSITSGTPQQQCNSSGISQVSDGFQLVIPDLVISGTSYTTLFSYDTTLTTSLSFNLGTNAVWLGGGQQLNDSSAQAYAADSLRGKVIGKKLYDLSSYRTFVPSASTVPTIVPCTGGGSFSFVAAGPNTASFTFNNCVSSNGDSLKGGLTIEDNPTSFVINTANLWNTTSYQGVSLGILHMNARLVGSSATTSPTAITFINDINGTSALAINTSTALYIYDRSHSETQVPLGSTILNFTKVSGNFFGGKAQGWTSPNLITPYSDTPDPVPLQGSYGLRQINFFGSPIIVSWNQGTADISLNNNNVGHFDNVQLAIKYKF